MTPATVTASAYTAEGIEGQSCKIWWSVEQQMHEYLSYQLLLLLLVEAKVSWSQSY